jgi:hypothetical protein
MTVHQFCTGFEGGTERDWFDSSLGSISVSTTAALSGTYGGRINPSAGPSQWDLSFSPAATTIGIGRFRFKFNGSLPAARSFLMRWPNSAQSYRLIFDPADNTIRMAHYNSSSVLEEERTGPVITAGTEFYLDWLVGNGANQMMWQIDGVSQTTVGPNAGYTGGFGVIRLGELNNQTMDLFVDDIVVLWTNDAGDVASVAGAYPIGDGYVTRLAPIAAGTHSGSGSFGVSTGVLADAWQFLDDLPSDTGTDYIEQTTIGTGDYVEHEHADLATTETRVDAVVVHAAIRSSFINANNAKIHVIEGANDYTVYNQIWLSGASPWPIAVSGVPTYPWTPSKVNALKSRWGYSSDVDSIPRLPSIYFEVAVGTAEDFGYWDMLLEGDIA